MLGYKTSRIRPPSESFPTPERATLILQQQTSYCQIQGGKEKLSSEKTKEINDKLDKTWNRYWKNNRNTIPRWLIYTDVPQPSRPNNRTHIRTHFYQASPSLMDPYIPQLVLTTKVSSNLQSERCQNNRDKQSEKKQLLYTLNYTSDISIFTVSYIYIILYIQLYSYQYMWDYMCMIYSTNQLIVTSVAVNSSGARQQQQRQQRRVAISGGVCSQQLGTTLVGTQPQRHWPRWMVG